jgi:hypothetical protein
MIASAPALATRRTKEGPMKRLLMFALVVVAIYMAWTRGPGLFEKQIAHEVVVTNASRSPIVRLRIGVAGRTFVAETLLAGDATRHSFRTTEDSRFHLVWQWGDRPGEPEWTGGRVPRGPLAQRHQMRIDGQGGVIYFAEDLPGSGSPAR